MTETGIEKPPAANRSCEPSPVIVLNMFYSGLGIARAMAGKGVRVVGLSADPKVYGNFSRLCEVRRAPNSQDEPEALARFLIHACDGLQGAVIFPTRDADVLFLDRFRVLLGSKYRLCIPPPECLKKAINKYELARLAQGAGVATPRTLELNDSRDIPRVWREVGFPCVLKPVSAVQWRLADAWQKVGARKAVRIESKQQLVDEYQILCLASPRMLAQEWIEGATEQIVVLGGYADANSNLLAYFTARKIVQSPDDCGTGCIVRSEPLPQLVGLTERLLKALRYRGMAEVEFKYDSASRTYKLIEINTRHWDQHELGVAGGVNLTWTAYCDFIGRTVPQTGSAVNATWIAEDALLMRVLRSTFRPELRIPNLRNKLSSGRRIYGIYARKDPLPALKYFALTLCPSILKAAFARAVKGLRTA